MKSIDAEEHRSMRIFVSYSHKQRETAVCLTTRLHVEGHTPFLDANDLPKGEGYDRRVREEIAACDLFLFLLSPDSVKEGTYARSELAFAEKKWPNPTGRVLPVLVEPTANDLIPPYLKAVVILAPKGDLVPEVLAEVAIRAEVLRAADPRLARGIWRRPLLLGLGLTALLATAAFPLYLRFSPKPEEGAPQAQSPAPTPPERAETLGLKDRPRMSNPANAPVHEIVGPQRVPGAVATRLRPNAPQPRSSAERSVAFPVTPDADELRRFFASTRVCTPTVEMKAGPEDLWLVCRCHGQNDGLSPPSSRRLRPEGWRDGRWEYVSRIAVSWSCP